MGRKRDYFPIEQEWLQLSENRLEIVILLAIQTVSLIREWFRKGRSFTVPKVFSHRTTDGERNASSNRFHIRRGDFQFKTTRISADEIYANSKEELTPNSTVFIATDERNKAFFDPLREHYHLLFLDDFRHELENVNTNFLGMIDQLVASRGRIFFGCWFSTFTGFIMRLRGYHSQNSKAPGYKEGILPNSYYYATLDRKFEMHTYQPLRGGFFNREFPTSWRGINKGVGKLK